MAAGNAGVADRASAIDADRFRSGDESYFQRVLEEYSPLIQSVVWSQMQRYGQDRDDMYQEICMRIWERRAQYSGQGSLGGWINRIAHRMCWNWRRQHAAREARQELQSPEVIERSSPAGPSANPVHFTSRNEFMNRLRESLAALPERQANAFILIRLDGYTAREAAKVLKVTTATVRSHLRHATEKLRDDLKEFKNGLS